VDTPTGLLLDKNRTTGYISGYPNGTYGPNNNITRYEAAVMFYNLILDPDKASYKSETSKFSDVSGNEWFSEAVGFLVAKEVLTGYPDGTFKGVNPITRAEFVTVASKFGETNPSGNVSFNDVSSAHWAMDYITSAFNNGWITGYPDGSFGPDRNITRAEAAVLTNRILGWEPASEQGNNPFSDISESDWFYRDVLLAANGR
jgi:hypothetical protein